MARKNVWALALAAGAGGSLALPVEPWLRAGLVMVLAFAALTELARI
jgi:hypothetical protein